MTDGRAVALPGVAQRSGTGVGLCAGGEFAIKLGQQRPIRCQKQLHAGGGQRRVLRNRRAVDREAPGSAWNTALSAGLLTQSCAQARRPRKTSGILSTICKSSKRAPSSLRVSVALIAP